MSAARAVQVAAFRQPGSIDEPTEARLVDALRVCDGWIPSLSLVALVDSAVVGGVRVEIGDDVIDATVSSRLNDLRQRLAG